MKRNDWIFATTVLVFSLIFWKQRPGLNFLIMNMAMIIGSVAMERKLMINRNWMLSTIGALVSSVCVFVYGDLVSLGTDFAALLMMSAYAMNPRNSVIVSVFQSFCSVSVAFAFMITDGIQRRQKRIAEGVNSNIKWRRIGITLIAIAVLLVFFLLYRESSVLFNDLTKKIDLSFISPAWIGFTLLGSLVMYGFYYHHSIEQLSDWEAGMSVRVIGHDKPSWLDNLMSVSSEKFAGVLLLVLLNILLLIVNFLDVSFIFGGVTTLPVGVNFSEYVHQGIGMVILSIVLAMFIILYFFRGRMNFEEGNSALKNLALLWIIQNAVMILSTCWRNNLYIETYGLTYKRIGVYVYLVLALFGVISVGWKVIGQRSNAFLFRINTWFGFIFLVSSCTINWDLYITNYNLKLKTPFDIQYFSQLSYRNFPVILDHLDGHPGEFPQPQFNERLYSFMNEQRCVKDAGKWPSGILAADRTYQRLLARPSVPQTWNYDLEMNSYEIHQLHYFPLFANTHNLLINNCGLTDLGQVGQFTNVQRIEAKENPLTSISGVERLPHLEYISLDADQVKDLDLLLLCKELKEVDITNLPEEMRIKLTTHFPKLNITEHSYNDWWP